MTKKLLTNEGGFHLSHANLVQLRNQNLIQLGIINEVAGLVSRDKSLSPTKTTASTAFKFWNFVAIAIFILGIYWGVTGSVWWVLVGIVVSGAIVNGNKSANAENLLDAAMVDKDFYEKILALNGWIYQFDDTNMNRIQEVLGATNKQVDVVSDFINQFQELDMLTFWDETKLCHPKAKVQEALISEIKAATDETHKEHLKVALLYTCQFVKDLGEPVQLALNQQLESLNPSEMTDDELKKFATRYIENKTSGNDEKYSALRKQAEAEYAQLTSRLN